MKATEPSWDERFGGRNLWETLNPTGSGRIGKQILSSELAIEAHVRMRSVGAQLESAVGRIRRKIMEETAEDIYRVEGLRLMWTSSRRLIQERGQAVEEVLNLRRWGDERKSKLDNSSGEKPEIKYSKAELLRRYEREKLGSMKAEKIKISIITDIKRRRSCKSRVIGNIFREGYWVIDNVTKYINRRIRKPEYNKRYYEMMETGGGQEK